MTKQISSEIRVIVMMAVILTIVAKASSQAQPPVPQERTSRIVFANGQVSFRAPSGFSKLTSEEISTKFGRGGVLPRMVIANAGRTTSIAYDLLDQPAPSSDLDELRRITMQGFAQLPKLKWVANEVRRVGGREWAYLEFTAASADQDIHNVVLLSIHNGRPLLFNFNSTVTEFPKVEHALRASMTSIATAPMSGVGTQANQSGGPRSNNRFTFADGHITFLAPAGFTELTPEEIAVKYPRAGPPRHAVGNAGRTTAISYDLRDQYAPSNDLEAGRRVITTEFEQGFQNLKWVVNRVHRFGNRDWMQFEFTELSIGVELHHIALISVYEGRILNFTCSSPSLEFPKVERALRASMDSINTTP